jgi:excisionase family DNA binding protein
VNTSDQNTRAEERHPLTTHTCEPLIDAGRAAALLDVHPKTVKRLAAQGLIPGMKIGKLWRFRASALDDWMRAQIDSARHPCPTLEGEP